MDVLELTQQYLNSHLFKLSQQDDISISQQFKWMHERTIQFFNDKSKAV
jgi:TetR/AcrR family transcriptional regulator, transcriptional repressor for nem operon